MKDFEEIRNKQIEEWKAKKPQRLALRNCKFPSIIYEIFFFLR